MLPMQPVVAGEKLLHFVHIGEPAKDIRWILLDLLLPESGLRYHEAWVSTDKAYQAGKQNWVVYFLIIHEMKFLSLVDQSVHNVSVI
jgi:hypothetical protein